MRIKLVDFDSKIPNLALMKISSWEKHRGNEVGLNIKDPDKIYVSVVFSKNREQAAGIHMIFPGVPVEYGGPGWDLASALDQETELLKPDYDLYPSTYSQGFTTRGCIRKCKFCVVPIKEGKLRCVQHPSEFHDDRFKTCMLMDNNLLGAPKKWVTDVLAWFHDTGIGMLDHGFDARLLTEEYAGLLKDVKHPKGIRFAWDNIEDEPRVIRSIDLLKNAGFNLKHDVSFYVLAGFNSTFEQDLYRCNKLREMGVNAFVMPYTKKDPRVRKLAKWANRRWAYWSAPFESHTDTPRTEKLPGM